MKNVFKINFLASLILLIGCGSKNTDLQAPPEKHGFVSVQAETQTVKDPKVNILFVVDNSGSMKGYQEKLAQNMKLFSNQFFKNARIDYKIGVVPVYDSKYLNDQTDYRPGRRKMNALGQLVPLKGLSPDDKPNQLFITRETKNAKQVLQETVAIGVQWGPEAEESFSPVLAIADPKINVEKNQGFYEKDAYLAVIFLTDADDVTPGLSGEDFYQRLVDLKDGDRTKIFIAAAIPDLRNRSESCSTDGRGPLQSIPALLATSGAMMLNLCSANFGIQLASFGQYLVQRVGTQRIALGFTPDISSIEVSYGTEEALATERAIIPRGREGYYFDPDKNEIVLSNELQIQRKENAMIYIRAIPANLGNYKNGRLNEI